MQSHVIEILGLLVNFLIHAEENKRSEEWNGTALEEGNHVCLHIYVANIFGHIQTHTHIVHIE